MDPHVHTMSRRHPVAGLMMAGLALFLIGAWTAEVRTSVTLADESRLWIEGSSSVNTFTCAAGTVEGEGVLSARLSSDAPPVEGEVQVPVRRFDCGKARMNADFYDALKAEQYDLIRFQLDEADVTAPMTEAGVYRLNVTGRLTIAGTERTVTMAVEGQRNADGTYRAAGSLPLRMTDFGIEPPTAVFGLIKAHDRITVHFDLVAIAQSTLPDQLNRGNGTGRDITG